MNILFCLDDGSYRVKLIDFSKALKNAHPNRDDEDVLTLAYYAPEVRNPLNQ
jgi:serine/threonine protein kinase